MRVAAALMVAIAVCGFASTGVAQEKAVSVSAAWIAEPAAGATSAAAYLEIDNPTMYDVYVVSTSSDAAGTVELREATSGSDSKPMKELTVPAFGSVALTSQGPHLVLKDLTRALKKGESVQLMLKTDGGITLKAAATVR